MDSSIINAPKLLSGITRTSHNRGKIPAQATICKGVINGFASRKFSASKRSSCCWKIQHHHHQANKYSITTGSIFFHKIRIVTNRISRLAMLITNFKNINTIRLFESATCKVQYAVQSYPITKMKTQPHGMQKSDVVLPLRPRSYLAATLQYYHHNRNRRKQR